jgi:hypothetical protein
MGLVVLRLTGATAPMRRVLWPVLLGALVALVVFAFNVFSSTLAMTTAMTAALGWVLSLALAAVPIGFLVGLLRMKMDKAAVATLVVGIHGERTRDSLERSIAAALHDPAVKLGYWSPAARAYVDGTGKALMLPRPGSGLSVAFVERGDEPLGAIIHDVALDDDKALLAVRWATAAPCAPRTRGRTWPDRGCRGGRPGRSCSPFQQPPHRVELRGGGHRAAAEARKVINMNVLRPRSRGYPEAPLPPPGAPSTWTRV